MGICFYQWGWVCPKRKGQHLVKLTKPQRIGNANSAKRRHNRGDIVNFLERSPNGGGSY